MPVDRRVHLSAGRHHADADRLVLAMDVARRERLRKRKTRGFVFRDDHEPRRVLVEPVHDAGTRQFRELRVVGKERVLEGLVRIAGAGMNDESGRLVDDDDVRVLPGDRERDVLRNRRDRVLVRRVERDALSARDDIARPRHAAVDAQLSGVDPALDARARILRQRVRQGLVETPAGRLQRQPQFALVSGGTHGGQDGSLFVILRRINSRGPVLCSQTE